MSRSGPGGHRAASTPETRRALRALHKAGWTITDKKNGWLCKHPNGVDTVTVHATPGGSGIRMMEATLKHYGVMV